MDVWIEKLRWTDRQVDRESWVEIGRMEEQTHRLHINVKKRCAERQTLISCHARRFVSVHVQFVHLKKERLSCHIEYVHLHIVITDFDSIGVRRGEDEREGRKERGGREMGRIIP